MSLTAQWCYHWTQTPAAKRIWSLDGCRDFSELSTVRWNRTSCFWRTYLSEGHQTRTEFQKSNTKRNERPKHRQPTRHRWAIGHTRCDDEGHARQQKRKPEFIRMYHFKNSFKLQTTKPMLSMPYTQTNEKPRCYCMTALASENEIRGRPSISLVHYCHVCVPDRTREKSQWERGPAQN